MDKVKISIVYLDFIESRVYRILSYTLSIPPYLRSTAAGPVTTELFLSRRSSRFPIILLPHRAMLDAPLVCHFEANRVRRVTPLQLCFSDFPSPSPPLPLPLLATFGMERISPTRPTRLSNLCSILIAPLTQSHFVHRVCCVVA